MLLLIMAALIGHAVWSIHNLETRMGEIVDVRNRKIQLATDLQEAAHNRHSALGYQAIAKDPFERDENFQQFTKWGFRVGQARNDLKAMTLDSFEKVNLAQQDLLVVKITALHDEISDLAARDHAGQALDLIAVELRPLNMQFTETVERLRHYERDKIKQSLLETQAATGTAIRLHLAAGAVALLLAAAVGGLTRRLLRRQMGQIFEHMSALREAGEQLHHQATHDPLTGLANRSLFYQRLYEAMAHAREENLKVGVLYLDLDDFKPVNDLYGHAAGDKLLEEVAVRLKGLVRITDTVARLGGDEFALVMLGLEGVEQRDTLYRHLAEAMAQPVRIGDLELKTGCSIGCAIFPADGERMDELLCAADSRMYEHKRLRKEARGHKSVVR
ncbi:MAG: GGDEF domain-containing protein [Betaproteobacteria bacterium]|nr:GGDEF domain-containing protein [Betaproteobacteria bacterium]